MEPARDAVALKAALHAAPSAARALPNATSNSTPPLDKVAAAMLDILDNYLPSPVASLPEPSVSIASVNERAVGLGNRRGTETRGTFPIVALKGVRLEAVVQFQLWAATPAEAETAMADLNARLMADRDALWIAGILRLALVASSPAEIASTVNAWRKTADHRVLYEFHYQDSDGAESLIARIPIDSDLEQRDLPARETTAVTDDMVRWDNEGAPLLVIRGPFNIDSVSSLTFIPGTAPSGTVTVKRTFDGAIGPPASHPTWAAFLAAVSGPNALERHAHTSFVSLIDFLAAFTAAGDPVALGDWNLDNVPDSYAAKFLAIRPAIILASATDRFEIAYQNTMFNQVGVVYLRGRRG